MCRTALLYLGQVAVVNDNLFSTCLPANKPLHFLLTKFDPHMTIQKLNANCWRRQKLTPIVLTLALKILSWRCISRLRLLSKLAAAMRSESNSALYIFQSSLSLAVVRIKWPGLECTLQTYPLLSYPTFGYLCCCSQPSGRGNCQLNAFMCIELVEEIRLANGQQAVSVYHELNVQPSCLWTK